MRRRHVPQPLDLAPADAGYYRKVDRHVHRFDAVTMGKAAACADLFMGIEPGRDSAADRDRLGNEPRWLGFEWLDRDDPDVLRRPECRQLRLRPLMRLPH
jgi:hypothetical protein